MEVYPQNVYFQLDSFDFIHVPHTNLLIYLSIVDDESVRDE